MRNNKPSQFAVMRDFLSKNMFGEVVVLVIK